MPHTKLKRSRSPEIRLTLFGFELNGQTLTTEPVLEMLDTYCNAAGVQADLRTLKIS